MTQQRRDNHSTEFGLWLRKQREIDSNNGYTTTNVDYVWHDYKRNLWMYIEEKRYGYMPKPTQISIFKMLDLGARNMKNYRGFHLLVFIETCPDDGGIILDGSEITRGQLINFLQFNAPPESYQSHFPPQNIIRIAGSYRNHMEEKS